MSTLQSIPRKAPRLRTALGTGLLALGALVAVGVAVVFLALASAHRRSSITAARPAASPSAYVPLIQYRGTGAEPTTHGTGLTSAVYVRAEHSYGAVP